MDLASNRSSTKMNPPARGEVYHMEKKTYLLLLEMCGGGHGRNIRVVRQFLVVNHMELMSGTVEKIAYI